MRPEGQAAMAAALLDPALPDPASGWPGGARFAIHRNNVVAGLAAKLGEGFPAIRRLVGEAFFRAAAAEFVRARPPRSPVLIEWGGEFADWLAGFPPAAAIPYLPDVARLERARVEAWHAAEAPRLPPAALARLAPEAMAGLRLRLHPSVRLVVSPYPVVALWRASTGREGPAPDFARGEAALVARPEADVTVAEAAPERAAFLAALLAGETLGAAAERAAAGAFDLAAELRAAFAARLVSGLVPGLDSGAERR